MESSSTHPDPGARPRPAKAGQQPGAKTEGGMVARCWGPRATRQAAGMPERWQGVPTVMLGTGGGAIGSGE